MGQGVRPTSSTHNWAAMPENASMSVDQPAHGDSFFVLRECRELFQRRLAEIARQSGILSPPTIDAFTREIGAAHDELASAAPQEGFEQTDGLTASRISLVGNDDLELDIRVGEIINRLKGDERVGHWRVQLRYMTLLNRPKMTAGDNPVGLEVVRRGLWAICSEGGSTLEQNLDFLNRLEEKLQAQLAVVYLELNNLLERHRVVPAQVQIVQRAAGGKPLDQPGAAGAQGSGSRPTPSGANALSALQDALRIQFGGGVPVSAGQSAIPGGGGQSDVTLDVSTVVMLNHLMDQLREVERRYLASIEHGAPAGAGEDTPLRALRSEDIDLPRGQPAAVALDTLSLIFEAIFAAPDLPDVVKAAIGRLQIPLLRLAIIDNSFFANAKHPARQLVNRMAHAAIGLAADTTRDHELCVRLGRLADAARTALEAGGGELTPYLLELDTTIIERDQANQTKSRPYAQLVLEHETRQAARASAQVWLRETLGNTSVPAIRQFLAEHWLRVMEAAGRQGGTAGARWQESATCIVELLWSVQPKSTADERRRLVALIPSLLKRINAELDDLKVSAEERAPFINACLDLQTAALRSRSSVPETRTSGSAPTATTPDVLAPLPGQVAEPESSNEVLELNGKLVQYLGQPGGEPLRRRSAEHSWNEGDWVRFCLPDGEQLCGRLCWQSTSSGTVLLYNAGWGYAVALAPAILEEQLRGGRARIVTESSLFDEAAERALSQITAR